MRFSTTFRIELNLFLINRDTEYCSQYKVIDKTAYCEV